MLNAYEIYLNYGCTYDFIPLGLRRFLDVPNKKLEEHIIKLVDSYLDNGIDIAESLLNIIEMIRFCKQYKELGTCLLTHTRNNLDASKYLLNECYYCEIDNLEDFKNQIFNEPAVISKELEKYVDFEDTFKLARNAYYIQRYFILENDQKKYIFKNSGFIGDSKRRFLPCPCCLTIC